VHGVVKYDMFFENLPILKGKGLLREIKDRTSPQGPRIRFNDKEFINFSSNDYLGLSTHSYVIRKAQDELTTYGYGSAASRLLGGGSTVHRELEDKIAQFKGTERALIFNSGYSANTGIIPAITNEEDVIFSDELNHASIIDGCRLSKARVFVYKHKDVLYLEKLMRKEPAKTKLVVTDSVFSMDGDIAPLPDLFNICKENNALLYIDDAHATGVIGNGMGGLSHFHLKSEPWVIQMGTFSKAFGSFGAFVTGTGEVIDWIINTARSFIYSTALPSCVIAASLAALEVIKNNPDLIRRLWDKTNKCANEIAKFGLNKTRTETPIIPIKTGTSEEASRISGYLFQNGIFAPSIKPPTVKEPRIRITITAAHAEEDIERLIELLRESIK
jgi:8-amino-7-oxononanoate synthase